MYLHDLAGHVYTDSTVPRPEPYAFQSLRLYEDNAPLGPMLHGPDPGSYVHRRAVENREIIEIGHGRYRLYQTAHLVFSSSDGSDPVTNGRRYWFTVDTYPALWEARGRYSLRVSIEGPAAIPRDARITIVFQYNRALMPDWSRARPTAGAEEVTFEVTDDEPASVVAACA